jgi:hypothetical protein
MRRHIFSINSGRSGSEYLQKVLNTALNVTAFHEPEPDGAGRRITQYPATNPTLVDRLVYPAWYARKFAKVRAIRRMTKDWDARRIYAESNHMFIFSFYDVVMDHLEGVSVILLRRWLPSGMRSFMELNHFTPEDPFAKWWFPSPHSKSAAATPLAPYEELDQADRIIAYLIDVEARAQRFKTQFPETTVVETRLEELNDLGRVREMFAALDLRETPLTGQIVGRVVNDKKEHKKQVSNPTTIEYCQERIAQYIEKCAAKGIELPALPHLMEIQRSAGPQPVAASV